MTLKEIVRAKLVEALNAFIGISDQALCEGLRDGTLTLEDAKHVAANIERFRDLRDELLGIRVPA